MKSVSILGLITLAGALGLSAGPVPVSVANGVTGGKQNITTSGSNYTLLTNISGSNGGRFGGTLGGYNTDFWCVDSQIQFNLGNSGQAYVVLLQDIPTAVAADSTRVRYGSIATEGASNGQWNNLLDAGLQTAQQRFTMAAWLISQYTPSPTGLTDIAENRARQAAIWSIMSSDGNDQFAGYSNGGFSASTFINAAKNLSNYGSVDLTKWAVVTWDVDGNPADKQTFLVQVVPEPGFYGVLALGLSGVFMALKRRKQS